MTSPGNTIVVPYPITCTTCFSVGSVYCLSGVCSEWLCHQPASCTVRVGSSTSLELIVSVPLKICVRPEPTPTNFTVTFAELPAAIELGGVPTNCQLASLSTSDLI